MRYVTELENIGDEICINLLNSVFAIAVPKTERSTKYHKEDSAFFIVDHSKKSVYHKIIKAGIKTTIKLPVTIVKALRSSRCFLRIFTLKAYPTEAITTNKAYM